MSTNITIHYQTPANDYANGDTVTWTLYDSMGAPQQTGSGTQIGTTGIFFANITHSDAFVGSLVWTNGTYVANEVINLQRDMALGSTGLDLMLPDVTGDTDARSAGIRMLRWLFSRFANKGLGTAGQITVYKDDSATIATAQEVSFDGVTTTRARTF